ncbi:uncharacterized protein V1513DRAFT_427921 [Lipomyces chichibuensis]|uniref:uncharacterized protein n=1 Tax=Lipomyces chichibuensis TaxID=1546026 RepID=UPI00334369EC
MDVQQNDNPKASQNTIVVTGFLGFVTYALLKYVANVILALTAIEGPHNGDSHLRSESSEHFASEDDDCVDGSGAQGTIVTSSIVRTAAYLRHDEGDRVDEAQLVARLSKRNLAYAGKHPVTSSLRRTAAYLRHEAGPFSLFRGMSAYIAMIAATVFYEALVFILPNILKPLLPLIVDLCVAPFSLVLTHIIITVPTKRTWFFRLRHTPLRLSLLTLPALAAESIVDKFASPLTETIMSKFAMLSMSNVGWLRSFAARALMLLLGIAVNSALFLFLSVPATVVRIRVQASLLPDGEEPIVPFDRKSFGTISSLRDAMYGLVSILKTFGASDRRRIFKLILKFYVIGWVVLGGFILLFFMETLFSLAKENPEIGQYFKEARSWDILSRMLQHAGVGYTFTIEK